MPCISIPRPRHSFVIARRVWRNSARRGDAMGGARQGRRECSYRMRYGHDRGRRLAPFQRVPAAQRCVSPSPPLGREPNEASCDAGDAETDRGRTCRCESEKVGRDAGPASVAADRRGRCVLAVSAGSLSKPSRPDLLHVPKSRRRRSGPRPPPTRGEARGVRRRRMRPRTRLGCDLDIRAQGARATAGEGRARVIGSSKKQVHGGRKPCAYSHVCLEARRVP
jgi:hypothetical protein